MALSLAGCYSHISMKKVAPGADVRGKRVRLPAPFIVGRPDDSGVITYAIEHLPDPDQEYAIDAWTILGKQNVNIKRTEGMIFTGITVDVDNAAVAKQLIDSAGGVGEAVVERINTQRTEAAAAQAAASAAAKATAEEKQNALAKAEDTKADAKAELEAAEAASTARQTEVNAAATEAKGAAQAQLDAAKAAVEDRKITLRKADLAVQRSEVALERFGGAHLLAKHLGKPPEGKVIYEKNRLHPGPIIYRIKPAAHLPGFTLEPVDFRVFSLNGVPLKGPVPQIHLPTWGEPKAKEEKEGEGGSAAARPNVIGGRQLTVVRKPGHDTATVHFNRPVVAVNIDESRVAAYQKPDARQHVTIKGGQDRTTRAADRVTIAVKPEMDHGDYTVSLRVKLEDDRWRDYVLQLRVL